MLPESPRGGLKWSALSAWAPKPSWSVWLSCAALLVGCTSSAAWTPASTPQATSKAKPAPRWVTPARLVVLPDSRDSSFQVKDVDGTERLIAYGIRMLRHQDGRLEVAEQMVPDRLAVKPLELPERLGGGWLFYSTGSRSHFWHAETWLGALKPIASFSADIVQVIPGFDRLYLGTQGQGELIALDPSTWQPTDLGPLPPAPGYTSMAFAGEWVGAVESDVRGVLITLDAGASWTPLEVGSPPSSISGDGAEILINTFAGRISIDAEGEASTPGASLADSAFANAKGSPLPAWADAQQGADVKPGQQHEQPLGDVPLRVAALGGWPDTPATAVVMANGNVARVRLSDGKLLDLKPALGAGAAVCHGAQVGGGVGFICGDPRGSSVVYSVSHDLNLTPLLSFPQPRYIAASGTGGLVIRGSCDQGGADTTSKKTAGKINASAGGRREDAAASVINYCVRSPKGKLREVRVRGDLGVERVVALQDGRVAVLVPPRLGAPGTLLLIREDGSSVSHKLKIQKSDVTALVKKGLWLDGIVERSSKRGGKTERVLSGWVAGGGPFVGVEVSLDGEVRAGEFLSEDIDRALLSGNFGLAMGRGGLLRETVDGGFTWSEAAVPPGFGDRTSLVPRPGEAGARAARGCSPVGCSFGNWVRVGWEGKPGEDDDEAFAAVPQRTELPSLAGGRWTLDCVPTGAASSRHAKPLKPAPRRAPSTAAAAALAAATVPYGYGGSMPTADTLASSAWISFLGVPPPAKAKTDLGFDFGNDNPGSRLRAYIWGPQSADWGQQARWVLRVEDAFDLLGVWNTAVSRPDWADPVSAAMSFGLLTRWGGYANWRLEQEPDGNSGLLVINVRGTQIAYVLEEDRAPLPVQGSAMWALNQTSGIVKVDGSWYFGSTISSQSFRVYRLDGDEMVFFADFPMRPGAASRGVQLVRSTQGDALGILTKVMPLRGSESRWYVFPVDIQSKEAGEPLELSAAQLGATPRACGAEDQGWYLVGDPPVQPHVDSGSDLRISRVSAKLIADSSGLCLESLAAESSGRMGDKPPAAVPVNVSSVPMVVSNRSQDGQRWGYRCRL